MIIAGKRARLFGDRKKGQIIASDRSLDRIMASQAGRQGSMSPDLKQLISDAPQTGGKGKSIPSGHGEEGCKVCGRDEDHANLLLCEACNEEYHTYCLDPPLECVPDDDWFCGEFVYSI